MTTEFKGTPGPYEAVEAEDETMIGNGYYASHFIATVDKTIHEGVSHVGVAAVTYIEHEVFETIGRSDANAKLFAASWDLLEALRPFANYACDENIGDPCDCHNCKARAAIRKATTT